MGPIHIVPSVTARWRVWRCRTVRDTLSGTLVQVVSEAVERWQKAAKAIPPARSYGGGMLANMNDATYRPVQLEFDRLPSDEMAARGHAFVESLSRRRSVREFTPDSVPRELIETAIAAANTSPSGANRQPWHFVAVSDPAIKTSIRQGAEEEEREFYEGGRASEEWLRALAPLGTEWRKPFLEIAPWLVVVFKQIYTFAEDGSKLTNYYVNESVGIACGLFIAAIHQMGLATLTHTPQPMRFLTRILDRPGNERPYILFPVGYPAPDCQVPAISKKDVTEVTTWFEMV